MYTEHPYTTYFYLSEWMPWVFIFLNTLHMNIPAPFPPLNSFSKFKYGRQSSMEGPQEAGGFGFNESGYWLVRKITVSM